MKLLFTPVLFLFSLLLSAQSWQQQGPFAGGARDNAVSFVLNDVAYVGMGDIDNTDYVTDFYRYEAATDAWTPIAPFPGPGREHAVSFALNGKGYVGLGADFSAGATFFNDFYMYDPLLNNWSPVANFSGSGRSDAIAFVIDNAAYVGFGSDASNTLKDLWKFSNGAWQSLGNASINERWGATAFAINGKGYVVAGIKGSSFVLSDVQEYNPANNSWTEKIFADGLNLAFTRAEAFVLNNQAYICYGNQKFVTRYTPATNQVTNLGDIVGENVLRVEPTAFAVGGKGYFGLGYALNFNGNSVLKNDLWEFSLSSGVAESGLSGAQAQVRPGTMPGEFVLYLSSELATSCQVEVFDAAGRRLLALAQAMDQTVLNLTQAPAGVYIVRLSVGQASRTQRIVR